jgi:hypothetical protein
MNLKINVMDEFVLILRHPDGSKIASPEQLQQWMQQTMEWMASIPAPSKVVGGTGLPMDLAKVVHHKGLITDGPFGEIKETIGGFIRVEAPSIDAAAEFAKGCPVLQGEGNTVEVRRVARNDGTH